MLHLPAVGAFSLIFALGLGCKGTAPASPDAGSGAALCVAVDPGPARLRRLTRFELGNVLADSLGVDPALASLLPPDEISQGYDNSSSAYSVSASHVLKALEMAEAAAAMFTKDTAALHAVAACDPLAAVDSATCLPAFVKALGAKLWRRPLVDAEVADTVAVGALAADGDPVAGLTAVVAILLQAPDVLYRPEFDATGGDAPGALPPNALATRLAFLITSTGPDDTLLAEAGAAAGGALTADQVSAQTERLLQQPRALESFQHFVNQWWELGSLPSIQKDVSQHRTWTAAMPAAFAEETSLFLKAAWQEGPTLDRLFRGTTTFVDADLAAFYGYPPPAGAGFQAVALDPARASGLFTQGSFLATHAKADQTSPVTRGRFVRAQLFCTPPPPPPANIVITPPVVNPRLSTRERFQQHTASGCAGCHKLMDPIGFAFEHFDAAGIWRDVDAGKPVDSTGSLTGTDVDGDLKGVPDLAARIAKSAEVRTCVATQWFRWAFGRDQETADDLCTIGALSDALAQAKGDLRALPRATVRTATFLNIRAGQPGGAP